jgi:HK97 family phage major capsid protein
MTPEIKEKIEAVGKSFEDFKAAHKKELEEIKASGKALNDTVALVEKMNERVSKAEGELEAAKAAMNRSRQSNDEDGDKKEAQKYVGEMNKFLRKGDDVSLESCQKAYNEAFAGKGMSVIVDADGGFLVSPEMSAEVVKKVYESTPIRQLASVQTISSDSLEILEDLDEIESGWVGENESRPGTNNAKLKMVKIPVHELYAKPKATQKMLDDSAINIESWLSEKFSAKFGRDEATSFVSGDGVKRPKGILSYASGSGFDQIERITTAAQYLITGDDLIEIYYSLKDFYLGGAAWLLNRNTVKVIRKLKGSDGQYLWSPGLNGDGQGNVLGKPIYQANDLFAYDSATIANNASKEQIIFGDLKQGYQIVDRFGIRVLRDPYSAKPYVEFYGTKRVGGGVKNFEAIKILKTHA